MLFGIVRTAQKLHFAIPITILDRDFLLVGRNLTFPLTPRLDERVVRWKRIGNRLYLVHRRFAARADTTQPIFLAVSSSPPDAYVADFKIDSVGSNGALVVDVSSLFVGTRPGFLTVKGLVADRSFIEMAAAFPDNINITAVLTGVEGSRVTTETVHYSFLRLPDKPLLPRVADSRIGYLQSAFADYSDGPHGVRHIKYIHRFRLEKTDSNAHLSEPLRPIVFWIDPATPNWLVPWIERGVEEWQRAFEEAGYRRAIVARRAPTPAENPCWSKHDARHSVIHWFATEKMNAHAHQVVDPRSGEVIKADVFLHHNYMKVLEQRYFVQVAPLDHRARRLPLPDSLLGRLVQGLVAHEIGHAIGLDHNNKASSTIPTDSVRSISFLRRVGYTPSIMDYTRFNYVAQPEDAIPVNLLVPAVGPYDRFAVRWGYSPVAGARSPDEERLTLDQWASTQDTSPWLRYNAGGVANDVGNLAEAVGDADPVRASTLGLRNLESVFHMLLQATERPGEDYELLKEVYERALEQWRLYMGHVVALVGGINVLERRGTGVRFTPVPQHQQRDALNFLSQHAFNVPRYFLDTAVLGRMEPAGAIDRVASAQIQVLNRVLAPGRLSLLVEYEALSADRGTPYTVTDLMIDLRRGIWKELVEREVQVTMLRRNLQRGHVAAMDSLVNSKQTSATSSDVRVLVIAELQSLDRAISDAVARAADNVTRVHLRDIRTHITRILAAHSTSPAALMR